MQRRSLTVLARLLLAAAAVGVSTSAVAGRVSVEAASPSVSSPASVPSTGPASGPASGPGTAARTTDADELLARTYAPVVALREQAEPCGPGEPYVPIEVDALFGRSEVVLRGPDGSTLPAPTADDLAGRGEGWYLDLPGNALRPGCSYERFADGLGAVPAVYARVLPDGEEGLALQYWFFYVYNDWNDRHEGDWEMIQLLFDDADPVAAATAGPTVVAFAQHEGAELADWTSGDVEIVDGTHPVVYPGDGSHAAYFRADQWFGKSAQSGFGCDDTSSPHRTVEPDVVLLDDGDLPAWLTFTGRWGERQPSFNNGPTGPNTKEQWDEPRRWVDEHGRRGAVALPAGGSRVTDSFCALTAAASSLMFRAIDRPVVVGSAALLVVLVALWLARRTTWSPVVLPPSDRPRAGGQIVRSAFRTVRREPWRFAGLGALLPVAGVVAAVVQALLFRITGVGALEGVLGEESVFGGLLATSIGVVVLAPAAAVVAVASMSAVRRPEGERARVHVLVAQAARQRRAVLSQLAVAATLGIGLLTVALLPFGLWWQARTAVAGPAALDTDRPFATSVRLTERHRLRALGIAWTAIAIGAVVPLAIGLGLLLLSDASFTLVNLIAGVAGLFTVPLAGVVSQLQYDDLRARAASTG